MQNATHFAVKERGIFKSYLHHILTIYLNDFNNATIKSHVLAIAGI